MTEQQVRQRDVAAAMEAALAGDLKPWRDVVLAGIREGSIKYETSKTTLSIRAIPRTARRALGQQLTQMREHSGMTHQEVADRAEVSLSCVMRHMAGATLGQWVLVRSLVQAMDGDPNTVREAYARAKAERLP